MLDSGAGGLTVLLPILSLFPPCHYLYFADTAWCPYGAREQGELRARIHRIVGWLVGQGCSMVVVACNTATAAAIRSLRESFSIPFIGMEPAVKPAAIASRTGHIGVLATEVTLRGDLFRNTTQQYADRVAVHYAAANALVPLVEQGQYEGEETENTLRGLLAPLLSFPIDHLVLGCTHFPFLRRAMLRVLPEGVTLVDPAPAVATHAREVYSSFCAYGVESSSSPAGAGGNQSSLHLLSSGPDAEQLLAHLRYYADLHEVPLGALSIACKGRVLP